MSAKENKVFEFFTCSIFLSFPCSSRATGIAGCRRRSTLDRLACLVLAENAGREKRTP